MPHFLSEIFVVTHIHVLPGGEEDIKGIGVYLSEDDAERAIANFRRLPGFSESPNTFYMARYPLGVDFWVGGYSVQEGIEIPTWARGLRPYVDESGDDFARRILDRRYGHSNWPIGGRTEWHKLRKIGNLLRKKT